MSSDKLFQTAGAACEKARSAKDRLVQLSCHIITQLCECASYFSTDSQRHRELH